MRYSYFLYIIFSFSFFACGRIKKEGEAIAVKTEQKIKDKAKDAIDKVVPAFDAYKPDTKANKKRFKDFLGIEPTTDVRNILCVDDVMGIDATYKFTFKCEDTTISKIIACLQLTKTTNDNVTGISFGPKVDWWDEIELSTLTPYWKKGEHETYWYLWYDKAGKQAWFLTFDM